MNNSPPSSHPHSVVIRLCFLCSTAALAVCAAHLLGSSSLLTRLARDSSLGLFKRALDFVCHCCLSLVVSVRSSLLGDTCASGGSLRSRLLGASLGGGGLALALRTSRDGR